MVVTIKDFGKAQQEKILRRYERYYNKNLQDWQMPSYIMKNIIGETWDLSKVLTKHKKLDQENILNNVRFETLVDIKDKYNELSQEDFYKYIVERLRTLSY